MIFSSKKSLLNLFLLVTLITIIPDHSNADHYLYINDVNNGKIYFGNAANADISTFGTINVDGWGMDINPDGKHLYVANSNDDTVSVIDTVYDKVTKTISVGDGPSYVCFSKDGSYSYVSNYLADSVSVIDASNHTVLKTIFSIEDGPTGLYLNPTTSHIYVYAFDYKNKFYVIDTEINEVIKVIDLSSISGHLTSLVFNPIKKQYYLLDAKNADIIILDSFSDTIVETINIGSSITGGGTIALHPSGEYLYVTRGGEDAGEFNDPPNLPSPSGSIYIYETDNFKYISKQTPPGVLDFLSNEFGVWYSEIREMSVHPFGTYVYFCLLSPENSFPDTSLRGKNGLGVLNTITNKIELLTEIREDVYFRHIEITTDFDKAPTIINTESSPKDTTCELSAMVNPNGLDTNIYFEYGSTETYGESSAIKTTSIGIQTETIEFTIEGLKPSNNYNFRMVAMSSAGTVYSENASFQTTSDGGSSGGGCFIDSFYD